MTIDLGILNDGSVMVVSSTPLPHIVKRVEYYCDERLVTLVYQPKDGTYEDDMLEYEVPHNMAQKIEASANIIIYSLFPDHDPIGYKAPLIKVGAVM